jgi:RNA polymerase sigma-70 factor (ECF subfamily)
MVAGHSSQDRFATSRWSQVLQRDTPDKSGARDALAELSARYRYPVYAYLRRSGHPPAGASLLTEHFLKEQKTELPLANAATASGQFRAFLLVRLHAFLIRPPQTRTLAHTSDIDELEARYLNDRLGAIAPEQAFHLCYARELLQRAHSRLAKEANEAGRGKLYNDLEPFLAMEPEPGRLGLIANAHHASAALVAMALKRLRQRFRELVDEELIETVGGAADLEREREALFAALSAQAQ